MDNIQVAAIGLAGVVVGSVITASVQLLISSQQRDTKMVEIAIGVLAAKPDENVKGARAWAIRVVERHSGTPFEQSESDELKNNALPYEHRFDPLPATDRFSPLPAR
jgi:hypothetical protein